MRYRHFLVLPSLLLAVPLIFYAIMGLVLGFTLEEMRDLGLVAQSEPAGNPLHVWSHFDFGAVDWSLVPTALPTWFGMCAPMPCGWPCGCRADGRADGAAHMARHVRAAASADLEP